MNRTDPHPYDALTPEVILDAVEDYGGRASGAILALNSYENRVYRVDLDDGARVVAKFYRPGRWPDAVILEEHAFTRELAEHEIPVVAPLAHPAGATLHHHAGFRLALYPWQPGRAPEFSAREDWTQLGRFLGRLHRLGAAARFAHRPRLSVESFGARSAELLLHCSYVPQELRANFGAISAQLLARLAEIFARFDDTPWIRLHGDCHLGNILWSGQGPYFVDFDDCLSGPAVQDLWMLLSGDRADAEGELAALLSGYAEFMDFDAAELALIEPLRSLRLLRYNAWIAERWEDPAFPRNFPWFTTTRHWETLLQSLREQLAALDEEPIVWRTERR